MKCYIINEEKVPEDCSALWMLAEAMTSSPNLETFIHSLSRPTKTRLYFVKTQTIISLDWIYAWSTQIRKRNIEGNQTKAGFTTTAS
ncbi:hypothetical protein A4A49_37659 [Nicotiana attenuata]|uniref:Uncharacterized protein n=1 Tax=Nicotiana attenuata TaxID=49451 RepID=A0A1J6JWX2_NICAT|nr:hypothetical protein A4A49_37659 [Nicotiana attenuata]